MLCLTVEEVRGELADVQVLINPFISFNPYLILELESWKSVARNTTVCKVVKFRERHLHKLKFWINIAWYVKN